MIGSSTCVPALSVPLFPSPSRLRKINSYLLSARLGYGASSTVYLAVHERTNEQYAIKRIKLSDFIRRGNSLTQLEREIRLIRRFHHPNILSLIEVLHDRSNNEVFLVLEYAALGSLGGYLDRGDHLTRDLILAIVRQILDALRYLHDSGFVHQDIKPHNILLHADGRAVLGDLGIGHSFQSAGMVVGSPAFQALGENARADVRFCARRIFSTPPGRLTNAGKRQSLASDSPQLLRHKQWMTNFGSSHRASSASSWT
jgi:serine/threonine protein kinase